MGLIIKVIAFEGIIVDEVSKRKRGRIFIYMGVQVRAASNKPLFRTKIYNREINCP